MLYKILYAQNFQAKSSKNHSILQFFPLLLFLSLAFYSVFPRTTTQEMFCTFQYSSSNCERKHIEIGLKGGLKLLFKLLLIRKNMTKWNMKDVN